MGVAVGMAAAVLATSAEGQVNFTGYYSQDFNLLPSTGTPTWSNNTTLPGWYAFQATSNVTGGTREATTNSIVLFAVDTGSSATGSLKSYGSASSSDRALGSLSSGTPGDYAYALVLLNNTSKTFASVRLSYTGEQWRNGGNTTQHQLVFDYALVNSFASPSAQISAANQTGYTSSSLSFTGPIATATGAALDGNAAANKVAIAGQLPAVTSWAPGQYLVLRWWDDNDSGNDHGLAIDDLTVTAAEVVTDTVATVPTVDGSLGASEYGPSNGYVVAGGGSGFAGMLGAGSLYFKSDPSNLYIGFQPGAGLSDNNNTVVVLLNSKAGGVSGGTTVSFNNGDASNRAVGRMLQAGLPSGFAADYAVAINGFGVFLYEVTAANGVVFQAGATTNGTGLSQTQFREISIPLSTIGMIAGGSVDFIAGLNNGQVSPTTFLSNESIPASPALNAGTNPGNSGGTFTNFGRFVTRGCLAATVTGPSNASACSTSNVQFSVTASGDAPFTYQWRRNGGNISDGVQYTGTNSATLTVLAGHNGGSFDCVVTNCSGASSVTSSAATLTETNPAAPVASSDVAICAGQQTTLSATVDAGMEIDWFTGSCGGTPAGSGTTLVVNPASSTTYYARTRNPATGCSSIACDSVDVTVNPLPGVPSITPVGSVCAGSTVTLSATATNADTIDWYVGSCSGSPVASGLSVQVTPAGTTTYFARGRNTATGCTDGCSSVVVTVVAPPSVSAGSGSTVCAGGTAVLSGSSTSSSGVTWSGGAGTFGDIHSATTTYTAGANESGNVVLTLTASGNANCAPATSTVTISVQPIPGAPGVSGNTSVCSGGTGTTLTATAGANEVVDWYVGSCGGTAAFTGGSFSVNPTSTTTYYAKARNTLAAACAGPCASVVVTVVELPTVSAGPNPTVTACSGGPYPLAGTATNAASVLWTTSGTGSFASATSATTSYAFGAADVTAGTVTLTLTAQPTAPCATPVSSAITVAIQPRPSTSVVDASYAGLPYGTAVTFSGQPGSFVVGCTAFGDIQSAINSVSGSDVYVGPGLFIGDLTISSHVNLHGAGPGVTTISGAIGGPGATITYSGVTNCELDGFTITRQGNNTTDWNNPGLNSAGIAFAGGAGAGCVVHDCEITGNRTGIDINNSSGATIRNNRIHFNRTGLIMRNVTDNLTVTENEIANNWTAGVLFLDASGGSNVPPQTALNCAFSGNDISGNWYAQIVERQSGGSLPAPGTTNLKNFSANWLGTTSPIISTLNSTEPGYAAQIPVAYGGSAVPPPPGPAIFDVCGPASGNVDITPLLTSGTDTNPAGYGFQGSTADVLATTELAQTGSAGRIQEAINLNGATVHAKSGTYVDNLEIDHAVSVLGANAGVCAADGSARGAESIIRPATSDPLGGVLVYLKASNITIDGFTLDGDDLDNGNNTPAHVVNSGRADVGNVVSNGSFDDNAKPFHHVKNITLTNNIVRHANDIGVNLYNDGAAPVSDGNAITCNAFTEFQGQNVISEGGPYTRLCVLMYNDTYAAVNGNWFDRFSVGVQTGNNYRAMGAGSASISSNTWTRFDNLAIWHNLHYANASNWTIGGNTITADPSAIDPDAWGIYVSSIQTSVGVACANNVVSHCNVGVRYWNCPTSANLVVSGGSLSNNDFGLMLSNYDPIYGSGEHTTLTASGILVQNNSGSGLNVLDEFLSTHKDSHLIVDGCTATGHTLGGGVSTAGAASKLSVRGAASTLTGNAYGIYATKGGLVLVEGADLRGNGFSGIQIGLGTKVDAGDCAGTNYTGLGTGSGANGSSSGGNDLRGYVFDDASPWAIENLNSGALANNTLAYNNNFGASASSNLNDVTFDHEDVGSFSTVLASQSGGQGIQTQPTNQSACAGLPATFTVVANGPVSYQWYFGAAPVGTNQNSYTIPAATLGSAGSYHVDVTDSCGNTVSSDTVTLTVQPGPTAAVGGPYSTCDVTPVAVSGAAGTAASVQWTSSGSGTFAAPTSASTTYTPSPADVAAGSVMLTFHALPIAPCAVEATAGATLTIQSLPTASAGGPYVRCVGAGTFAIGGSSSNSSQVTWTTSGTGTFGNIHAASTTYTPTPADEVGGSVILTLTADAAAPCTGSTSANAAVTFTPGPVVAAGGPYYGCGGVAIAVSGSATNASSVLWTTSGTGSFGDATQASTTYTPSPADATAGAVTLTLTAQAAAPCTVSNSANATMTVGGSPAVTYVDDNYVGLPVGVQVDWPLSGGGPLHTIGCDAFATIQGGVNRVQAGGNVMVAAGTYAEDVAINKTAHVLGAGPGLSVVQGVAGGSINTFEIIGQSNVELAGFTITRQGNAAATWNTALNNNGVLATTSPNLSLHNNLITGNRNGLNMQFMAGAMVRNNVITDNRTGVQCVDSVTNSVFTENEVTNNWTVGFLFRDETAGGSDTTGTVFTNNAIHSNWYGQLVYRNPDGHPATIKNFSGNWLGTTGPVATVANSAEPGYAAQIPAAFGGSAAAPGGQPDIAGDASGNFDITPMLTAGTDTNVQTVPARGIYGFQGDFSALTVTSQLAQAGTAGRVQEGNAMLADGALVGPARTENVLAGTYTEKPTLARAATITGANAGIDPCTGTRGAETIIIPDSGTATYAGTTTFVAIAADGITLDGLTVDGDNPALTSPFTANGGNPDVDTGISAEAPSAADGLVVKNTIVKNVFQFGIAMGATGAPARSGTIEHNRISNVPYWAGVIVYDDYYAGIENNCIEHVGVGIQTNNFYQAKPPGGSATINNNAIALSTEAIAGDGTYTNNYGLLVNLHYADAGAWQVSGNTIVNNSPRSAGGRGITVWSMMTDVALDISNNTVTDLDTGYLLWNCPTTSTIAINGGTVSGSNRGIVSTNFDTYGNAGSSEYAITGVSILDNRQIGIAVIDSPSNTNGASVYALVSGNTSVHGSGTASGGVSIAGADAAATIINNPASFTTSQVGVLVDGGSALIQNSNLTGNTEAGIRVVNNGRCDAGDCSGSDISTLGTGTGPNGSSTGLNNLSGYGFDSAAPFAVDNRNGSAQTEVRAQNNNYGATVSDNIETAISDNSNGALSHVFASQSGGPAILTDPSSASVCPGTSVTFTVIAYGQNHYQWYFGAAPVGADAPSYTVGNAGPADVGSYHVVVSDDCGNSATSGNATLSLLPVPSTASGASSSDSNYCASAAPAAITLTASGGSGTTFTWYTGSCGGSPIGTGLVLAGVPGPTTTTTYYGRWSTSCGDSACVAVTVVVNQNPSTPSVGASGSVCAGESFNLAGTAGPGEVIDWYSSCGGTLLGSGSPFPVTPGSSTTYFAKARNTTTGCSSIACASVAVTVVPGPTADAGSDATNCGGAAISLTGTATNYASVLWTTSGTGTFADATQLATTYTPSPADITAGTVTLTLTVQPNSPCATPASDSLVVTVIGPPTIVYVDDGYVGLPNGTAVAWPYPGAPGGPYTIGCNAFATIQGGVNGVLPGGSVMVAAGTYVEDVNASKTVAILGVGPAAVVSGAIGGDSATVRISANNVVVAGLQITRQGNTAADWNNPGLNSAGVAIQGLSITGAVIRDNLITGNRSGVDINNSGGHTIRNNQIVDNRTGLIFRNTTNNLVVSENDIANNWTVGIVFLDGSGGSNSPAQSATGSFLNNNISGNWYGQIVDRQLGGSLPAPGSNLKNFSGNWWGTTSPIISSANSAEPGYAAQIPVAFGGSAVPPGGQPDILGPASANFDVTPWLNSGVDTNASIFADTNAFQGDFSNLTVTTQLAQTGPTGRIQEGHNLTPAGGTVAVLAGTYSENVSITKRLTIDGAGAGDCDTAADPLTQTIVTAAAASTPVFDLVDVGGAAPAQRLTLRDMRITGASGSADGQSAGVRVSAAGGQTRQFYRFENLTITGNSGHGLALGSAGTINDVEVASSSICSNYRGVVVDDTLAAFDGLAISGSVIKNNAFHGLSVNGTASGSFVPTNISVSGTTFASNGQSNNLFQGSGDLSFFYFNGNASLTNVTVHTTGRVPVQFRGRGTDNFSIPWAPAGVITLNGLTVDGVADRSAIYMHYYASVNNVTLNNVDLGGISSSAAPFSAFAAPGMTLAHLGATPLALNNTIFPCQGGQSAGYVGLALFGTGGAAADCTTVFVGASTLAQKENCVFDVGDLGTVGDVTFLDAGVTSGPNSTSACLGAPASFSVTATGPGLSYQWYYDNLSNPVGTSSPTYSIGSVTPTDAGSYFVVVTGTCGSATSPAASLSITPGPVPATSASSDTPAICTGSGPASITLTAIGGSGDVFTWYEGGCGAGSPIGTGASITIPAPAATTTYSGRWSTVCGASSCVSTTVTHVAPPTAGAGGPYAICADGVVQLNGSASNADHVLWTSAGDGLFNNPSIPNAAYTPGPGDMSGGSVALTLTAYPNAPCASPATSTVTVTINPLPVAPTGATVDANNFCTGSVPTITLTAIGGSGAKLSWSAGSCGGPAVGSGAIITIPAPTSTKTYYARWINGCGMSACAAVTVTVYDLPNQPVLGPSGSTCSDQPFTLTGSVGAGETIDWFDAGCGSGPVGSGTSVPVSPSTTTTYFARARNLSTGCVSTGCQTLTVTVTTTPTAPSSASVDAPAYCTGSAPTTITLTASGGTGGVYKWYTGSCGGTLVGAGSPLAITAPSATETYYARREDGSCVSPGCAQVTVTVTNTPTTPASASVDSTTYCTGSAPSTITLTATGGTGGGYQWYGGSCGGTAVGAGSPLTITAPTTTTTYYVRRVDGACHSPGCVGVTVTVNASPVAPASASVDNASFCSGAVPTITLTAPGGSGDVLRWYGGSCGGAPVGVGSPLTIPAPSVSTSYFARWETVQCGNSSCQTVGVHVDPSAEQPTGINASANNYCAGSVTSLTLTAAGGSGATLEWFEGSCGGTSVGTGNPLTIAAPTTTKTYYARYAVAVCGPSPCASVTITVNPVTGACCTGWGTQKVCNVVEPINCQGVTTPTLAYRGNCTTCGAPYCCGADYNNNGHLEILDIFDYLNDWFLQVTPSDFNHDGFKNVQDIFDFLSSWFAGC